MYREIANELVSLKGINYCEYDLTIKGNVLIINYWNGIRQVKKRINFNDTKTILAANKQGLTLKDCILLPKSHFISENNDEEITEFNYLIHRKKVFNAIIEIIKAQNNIKQVNLRKPFIIMEDIKQFKVKERRGLSIFQSQTQKCLNLINQIYDKEILTEKTKLNPSNNHIIFDKHSIYSSNFNPNKFSSIEQEKYSKKINTFFRPMTANPNTETTKYKEKKPKFNFDDSFINENSKDSLQNDNLKMLSTSHKKIIADNLKNKSSFKNNLNISKKNSKKVNINANVNVKEENRNEAPEISVIRPKTSSLFKRNAEQVSQTLHKIKEGTF